MNLLSNTILPITQNKLRKSDPQKDAALIAMGLILFIGFLGILAVSIWANSGQKENIFWPVAGLSIVVGLSALTFGGFLGFLFGIPRSLQTKKSDGTISGDKRYSDNTNLEEISDWLTKIIVGVSLTQIPAIEKKFTSLTLSIGSGFTGYLNNVYARPYAGTLLVFYAISGFLTVYLWTRIYLLEQLNSLGRETQILSDKIDETLVKVDEKVEQKLEEATQKQIRSEERLKLELLLKSFYNQQNRIKNNESQPEYIELVKKAKPEPVKYLDDCQKGRWGGKALDAGYELIASIEDPDEFSDNIHKITIALVVKEVGKQLNGDVYFFLHDSFYPNCIRKIQSENNTASLVFFSYEAFTVGVVCNDGEVKLELDLNTYDKTPESYKYFDSLRTEEQLRLKLEELKDATS